MRPSNFQLIDKPGITKSIFLVNKEFNFSGEVSLEIDNNINIIKISDEEMSSTV